MSGDSGLGSVRYELEDGCDGDHAFEVCRQFFVSGCDSTKLFQPADDPFHNVSKSVRDGVEVVVTKLVLATGDDVLDLMKVKPLANRL